MKELLAETAARAANYRPAPATGGFRRARKTLHAWTHSAESSPNPVRTPPKFWLCSMRSDHPPR